VVRETFVRPIRADGKPREQDLYGSGDINGRIPSYDDLCFARPGRWGVWRTPRRPDGGHSVSPSFARVWSAPRRAVSGDWTVTLKKLVGIEDYSSTKLELIGQHEEVSPQTGVTAHELHRTPLAMFRSAVESFPPKRDRLYPPRAGPVCDPRSPPPAGVALFHDRPLSRRHTFLSSARGGGLLPRYVPSVAWILTGRAFLAVRPGAMFTGRDHARPGLGAFGTSCAAFEPRFSPDRLTGRLSA
jgi:hypothetical protein